MLFCFGWKIFYKLQVHKLRADNDEIKQIRENYNTSKLKLSNKAMVNFSFEFIQPQFIMKQA